VVLKEEESFSAHPHPHDGQRIGFTKDTDGNFCGKQQQRAVLLVSQKEGKACLRRLFVIQML
jgi:hypothetical protein